jgi:hypothetical protein
VNRLNSVRHTVCAPPIEVIVVSNYATCRSPLGGYSCTVSVSSVSVATVLTHLSVESVLCATKHDSVYSAPYTVAVDAWGVNIVVRCVENSISGYTSFCVAVWVGYVCVSSLIQHFIVKGCVL